MEKSTIEKNRENLKPRVSITSQNDGRLAADLFCSVPLPAYALEVLHHFDIVQTSLHI